MLEISNALGTILVTIKRT